MGKGSLRPDLQRLWEQLDFLPPRTVIVDKHGDAWQSGGYGYWYRAFDGAGITDFELAQRAGTATVLQASSSVQGPGNSAQNSERTDARP